MMAQKSKPRILVVDDESSVLFTYRMILEEKGYAVDTALTSQQAIELLGSQAYRVVLCDLSLEQDRNGFDVFENVRRNRPGTPCVLLTGYANEEVIARAENEGIAVLFKPIDVADLFQAIEDALRKPHARKKQASQ